MASIRFARFFAASVLSAGIIGGAALGLAGLAHADYEGAANPTGGYSTNLDSSSSDSTDSVDSVSDSAHFFSPSDYAEPATTYVPWASTLTGYSN